MKFEIKSSKRVLQLQCLWMSSAKPQFKFYQYRAIDDTSLKPHSAPSLMWSLLYRGQSRPLMLISSSVFSPLLICYILQTEGLNSRWLELLCSRQESWSYWVYPLLLKLNMAEGFGSQELLVHTLNSLFETLALVTVYVDERKQKE